MDLTVILSADSNASNASVNSAFTWLSHTTLLQVTITTTFITPTTITITGVRQTEDLQVAVSYSIQV